tara:strand:- start:81 stop:293 length:213 start_codon:yes stop_codon:yes gene_type:complete
MIRYNFHYQIKEHGAKELFAVKHCIRPAATKVYKHLMNLLEKNKVYSIGYRISQDVSHFDFDSEGNNVII